MASSDPPTLKDTVAKAALRMVPTVGTALAGVYEDSRARRLARLEGMADSVLAQVGRERLVRKLGGSEILDALFVESLETAARTGLAEKRKLLAKVAAAAIIDDAEIEQSQLVVQALRDLDAPHIRALARLGKVEDDARSQFGPNPPDAEIDVLLIQDTPDERVAEMVIAASSSEPVPIIASLIRCGVVVPATFVGGGVAAHHLTSFGRDLLLDLELCRAEAAS